MPLFDSNTHWRLVGIENSIYHLGVELIQIRIRSQLNKMTKEEAKARLSAFNGQLKEVATLVEQFVQGLG